MREIYNKLYTESQAYKVKPELSVYFPVWKRIAQLIDKEKIIEIGCGSGQLASYLIRSGKTYENGFDISDVAIHYARRMNPGHMNCFEVKSVFDVYKFSPGYLILCTETMEHIEDDRAVLDKMFRGTRFIFSVPDFDDRNHVRKFTSPDQIRERYTELDIRSIEAFKITKRNTIYLVDSYKI